MNTNDDVDAKDIKHYMFKTCKTFLDDHNARADVTNPFPELGLRFLLIHDGGVLLLTYGKEWKVPRFVVGDVLAADTIGAVCWRTLCNQNYDHFGARIIEPAFDQPLLEPDDKIPRVLFLSIMVTLSSWPNWRYLKDFRVMPLEKLAGKNNPALAEYKDKAIERLEHHSSNDLVLRFPKWKNFLRMRMCFMMMSLEHWKFKKSAREFYVGIMQKEDKADDTGFYMFETSEEVLLKMCTDADLPVYETDERYSLRGVSFKKSPETEAETHLCCRPRDKPELSFDVDGCLNVTWLSSEDAERLGALVLGGGFVSVI
ncbi:uncharacterized protein RCC_03960 [Ramularia collo-cygni]|uniref:Uncharacterized protein n=1 Tax=Ramularia collo-cygni TaxID=112498 RepID=A0A2D3UY54_9PEZI|nr:uncharacterized protein RCC_03960 [Ramularia collo-cygni]CZT18120.1 uncharacterized protein RCC_03960 [Ramularia collo-cygni]